tara:strand:+ start:2125 stop:4440 length:2316 start_codon:yes stop_codon:yes gene_type:complete
MDNTLNNDIQKEEVSIKELIFVIKSNFKTLLIFIFMVAFFGSVFAIISKPIFSSTGTIIIESSESGVASIFDMGLGHDKNYLDNEIQILKSRSTAESTVRALLNSEHKDNLYLFGTRHYKSGPLKKFFRTILLLDFNKKNIMGSNILYSDSLFKASVKSLSNNISVSKLRNTDVLAVSYSSRGADEAAFIINTLIEVYQKRDKEWASGEMSHLKVFLEDQLQIKESELNKIEQKLKEFQEKEHIYGLDDNSTLLLKQLTILESDLYSNEAKKNILLERKKYFEGQLNKDEKEFTQRVTNTIDFQLLSIRQELSSLEAEYISTSSREGDSHPAVIELSRKIKNLKTVLNNETKKYIKQGIIVANPIQYRQAIMDSVISVDMHISNYNSKLIELEKLVANYDTQLSLLPEKYLQFARYQRDKIILDETYSLMKQKLEEAKINQASQLGKIRVVDSATPSQYPIFPKKKIIVFVSALLGLVLGVIFILGKEYLDSTIKSIEEIERRGLPILAIIPAIGALKDSRKKKKKGYKLNLKASSSEKIERRLLTHEDPKSPISEAYRSLRTSLTYDTNQENCKIMLVSSSGPGEGKTTTVANLAITYANMGKKTLLVDADLRKPVIHKMFKNDSEKGFTNFLSGDEKDIKKIFYSTDVQNLFIIKSGAVPPNPSELLASKNMNKFIENAKKEFDVILFDTPPMIAVTDAFIINKHTHKALLVIRASVTQKGALERTLVNMNNMSKNIDGVIFNGVDESNTYGGGYYYNYYQNYYGNEDK